MQQSWAEDDDKMTFIVLDREAPPTAGVTERFEAGMCGDVNLFLNDSEDRTIAEIEVMIASPSSRGRGKGSEAARLMMGYAASTLGVRRFVAKILEHNAPSLKLFERLGFKEFARVPVFREVHMERILDEAGLAEAAGWLGAAQIGSYDVG